MGRHIQSQREQWPHRVSALIEAAGFEYPSKGYYDPDQEKKEHLLHLKQLEKNSEGLSVDDFDYFYSFPNPHEIVGFRCRVAMAMPTNLQLSNDQPDYTGSHGMQVYQDDQGDWSFKQPKKSLSFTVPLEAAAATLQRKMGLEAPESYAIDHPNGPAVVSKWYPDSHQEWQTPPRLDSLHPDDQMTIQKNHALDWLIGNHDSHVGNWMRTNDGKLVSIDKGQAAKYFGRDRLAPDFHPNYYAREPIYNQLWRDHASGRGQMLDPRQGELGQFVKQVQAMPDDELKDLFRPYAQAAAKSGLLMGDDGDRRRNLGPPSMTPNDPEAFLNALVERKRNLHTDLGDYYDRMSGSREIVGANDKPMLHGLDRRDLTSQDPLVKNPPMGWDPYKDTPNKEEWMGRYNPEIQDFEPAQLELEPWQNGDLPRPYRGNADPNFYQNNGYIAYDPDLSPGVVRNSEGRVRNWWKETPESLAEWQDQYDSQPGTGQMDLFGGPDHIRYPDYPPDR